MHRSIRKSASGLTIGLLLALAFALTQGTLALAAPAAAAASVPSCSWILETAGTGATNVAYPDTDATYWTMPLDTSQWRGVIINGKYPSARFFSFVTYIASGSAVDSINDVNIQPNPGSTNPFQRGPSGERHNYTVTVSQSPAAPGETNQLTLGDTKLAWLIYRIYLPNKGLDQQGNVPLPTVTLIAQDGSKHPVPACPFKKPAVQLLFLLLELRANGFGPEADEWQAKLTNGDPGGLPTDTSCQPEDDVVFWIPANTGGLFPNPANKYIAAPGLCFDANKVVVVRGQGAVFPNTYNGTSIYQPAIPGAIKLRYWSMCNNDQVQPYPVVLCQPDATTNLDSRGFYTYVIGQGQFAPSNLPADATWLPWGLKRQPNILIFRNMLPAANFDKSVQAAIAQTCTVDNQSGVTPPRQTVVAAGQCAQGVMGKYYPRAVFCNKELYLQKGWQACFAAAHRSVE